MIRPSPTDRNPATTRYRQEFGAELARRVGHPGNPSVQGVENGGNQDGDGGNLEQPLHRSDHGVETGKETGRGEEIREHINPLLHLFFLKT